MKRSRKRLICIFSVVAILAILAVIACVCIFNRARELDALQQEKLTELQQHEGEYDPQSIVLYDTTVAAAEKLADKLGAALRISQDGKFAALTLPQGVTIADVYADDDYKGHLAEMSADYQVKASELSEESVGRMPTRPTATVNDPSYSLQTYLDYLNLGTVWNRTKGKGITVAIIDTGIDTDHPEFAGRISEYSYNATEDKIVKDYLLGDGSYDWSLVEDEQGHGTGVAGALGASMNNSEGIVGVAPEVTIIVIKAECNANGAFARTSDLVFGLYYAIERDVDVVNMSFGGYSPENPYADATQLAVDSDVICVAAAGNESTTALCWPAADENVIGVGALAADSWELATYSNYGDNVDIVAPGTTYTAKMGGGYATTNGTSLASPVAAGVISLALSQERYATYERVCTLLYASSYDLGDLGADWDYGFGAIDATALILEERGTITYDMLTDELDDETGIFIRNHTLQELPEPERLYAVFDGWYYDPQCTEPYVYYEDRFVTDLTLYAHWVNEEDGVPYTYVELDDGTIEIRSYTGRRKCITIPEMIDGKPVTSIGDFAFSGESNLREVWLPDCLTHIGLYAFGNCSNLLHIDIPAGVSEIEKGAFYNNVRLSYVAFAGNSALTTIGNSAFAYCSKLTRFEVPAGVTALNGSAFVGTTSMQNISVHINNTAFTAVNGVLLNYTASTVVAYPAGRTGNEALPTTVSTIGAYAFAYTKRTEIALDGVQSIGTYAFQYAALEKVTIPDSVTSMGEGAFAGNFYLREVSLGAGLTSIPGDAFTQTFMLTSIEIPAGISQIGGFAFATSGLRTVTFAEDSRLMVIGGSAFEGSALTGIEIPASVIAIGDGAFAQNYALTSVTFAEGSNLISIGSSAFAYNVSLTAITFPVRLTTLGKLAFEKSGLTGTVTLPASLTSFGAGAFASCSNLTTFAVEEGNTAYKAVDGVVYTLDGTTLVAYPTGNVATYYTVVEGTQTIAALAFEGAAKLSAVTLPESLTAIEEYGMSGMTALTSIAIPDNVMQIGRYAFKGNSKMRRATFGVGSKLPRLGYDAFAYTGLTSFTVPANVSTMSQRVFEDCSALKTITFAEGSKLESISAYMFDGCTALTTVTFENGSALTSIQAHGFDGMSKLTTVNFGDAKLTNIDNFAFRYCDSLKILTLPETLTNIGRYAFYYCTALTDLALPASVEHIGSFAFLGTNELNVYFAAETLPLYLDEDWDYGIAGYYLGVTGVVTEGDWQYATLTSGGVAILKYSGSETVIDLTSLDFGGNVVNIGGGAFAYTAVESITLPETLVTIQAEAFYHSALQSVTIPASVQFIGREAFADTPLTVLTFAENSALKVVEQSAFEGTKSLGAVTLPASLTTMGRAAFRNSGITVLNFAENIGLTEIADEAFAYTNITALTLPDSITEIGDGAFRGTAALESATFGTSELMIRSNAFYQSGLTALTVPQNVTYIGEYAFVAMPRLTEFAVEEDNPYYKAVDGLLVSKTGKKLIAAPAGRTGELTLPVSIEVIGFGAFESTALSAVHFDEDANILSLGCRAFFGAKNLTEIHIPESVVAIDYYAFANCSALTTVTFAEGNQLRGVYEGAFYACKNLSNITLPDSINEISDFAFYGCAKLTELPVSETSTVKGIYSYAMAYTGITGELILPDTLDDIGDYAFKGLKVTSITVSNALQKELIIGIGAFAECNNLTEITVPFIGASFEDRDITWFGYIFGAGGYKANSTYVPASLKTVNINGDITVILLGAFYNLATLETIDVPETVDGVGFDAFYGTTAKYELHQKIRVAGSSILVSTTDIQRGMFGEGLSGNLKLADSIKTINFYTFYGCTSLTSIMIPDSVTSIKQEAFAFCSNLTSVTFGANSQLTNIGHQAFLYCKNLTSITIPDSVTSIDNRVFYGCENLTSVTFGENSQFKSIGESAFYMCENLTSVTLPASLTSIGDYAFSDCISLTSITLPASVTRIGDNAFSGCMKLYQVTNLSPLSFEIGSADNGCVAYYAKVLIDAEGNRTFLDGEIKIDTVDGFLFVYEDGEYKLIAYLGDEETVTFPTDIQGNAYVIYRMCGVKNVVIPEGVTSIGDYAFYDCTSLTSIILPTSLRSIGDHAFSFSGLTSITIPKGVTSIGERTFFFAGLASITIPSSVTSIGDEAFYGCENLTSVTFGTNIQLTSLGDYAFSDCRSLMSITLPSSVTSIGSGAFSGCRSLMSITLPSSVTSIGSRAFSSCRSLMSITLPSSVTSIGDYTFSDCTSLTSITLPDSVTSIGKEAFSGCTGLTSITLSSRLRSIGSNAFYGCENLYQVTNMSSLTLVIGGSINGYVTYYAKVLIDADGNKTYRESKVTYIDTEDGFRFMYANGTYELISYLGNEETVILPTDIQGNAYVIYHMRGVKNVVIPEGVTSIGNYAFYDCTSLTSITLPDSVTGIGVEAFSGCTGLTSITLPARLKSIGSDAFYDCRNLYRVTNLSSLTLVIGSFNNGYVTCYAEVLIDAEGNRTYLYGKSEATYIDTQDGFRFAYEGGEYRLIAYLGGKETVTFPTDIQGNAYVIYHMRGVENVVIPEGVTSIGNYAFYGCKTLTSITISEGVTDIGFYAFSGCSNLTSITLPNSLTEIDHSLFNDTAYYNDSANWVDGGLYIGNHLIAVDTNIKSFTVREGTSIITSDAFYGCNSLVHLTIGGDYLFACLSLTNLETLVITEIANSICSYFKTGIPLTLTKIVFAEGVQMRAEAFSQITGVTIFVEVEKNDTRWNDNFPGWSNGNTVVYGDRWINATFYNPDGSILNREIFTTSQVIRQPYLEIAGDSQYTYEVIGWDLDGDGMVDTIPATSTVDIAARPVVLTHVNKYRVTFLDKNGTTVLYSYVLPYGSAIPLPETPTKKGYTFLGWNGYAEGMTVEGDIVITSAWQHDGVGHTYSAPVWVVPTCTERGYNKHVCTICDEWYGTDYVAELGHTYTDSTVAPTCTERGYDLHACACDYSYKDNFVGELGHNFGEWITDVAATCTETGSRHRDCGRCDAAETEIIPVNGHTYTATVLREATCSSEGLILHVCSNCGSRVEEPTEKASHNYQKKYASKSFLQWLIDWILDVFFGYEGNQAYYYECVDCRHIQTAEERMLFAAAMDVCVHEYGDVQLVKSATCTEQGVNGRVCTLCGAVSDATTFDALGRHDHTEITVVPPTCTVEGYTRYDCTRCDDYYCIDFVVANGHTASGWIIDKAATCTSIGYQHKECTVCETILETAEIEKLAHTEVVDPAVAATCTATGLTEGKHCSVCNTVLVAQTVVNAKGHTASDWITDKAATCTGIGYKHKKCTVCETILETAEIAKLAHTEEIDSAVAATCTATGLTEGKHCSVCNTVLVAQTVVNANGHTASDWITDQVATCESIGYKHKECTACETILETAVIAATGHDYKSEVTAPTEDEMGYTTKTCEHCGESVKTDYVAPKPAYNSTGSDSDAATAKEQLPTGAVVAISAGGGVVVTSMVSLLWFLLKKKKRV